MFARTYPHGSRLGLHAHREAQLVFASRGVMQVTTPKGRWLVPPARAVWVPPLLEHAIDVLADIDMRTLYVGAGWLAAHPEAGRLGREFVVRVGPLLREAVLGLFRPAIGALRTDLLARIALFEMTEAEDAATFMPMPRDPRAVRAAELVLADPAGRHDLDDLARLAGSSRRTLTRLFAEETELSFKSWRQRARIMRAIELIGRGPQPMKALAARLGFSSVAAFGHAFRQVTGTTAGAYLDGRSGPT